MIASRTLSAVLELDTHRMSAAFSARGARMGVDLNPFINIDLFTMTGPVFAPSPACGFLGGDLYVRRLHHPLL